MPREKCSSRLGKELASLTVDHDHETISNDRRSAQEPPNLESETMVHVPERDQLPGRKDHDVDSAHRVDIIHTNTAITTQDTNKLMTRKPPFSLADK